MSARCYPLTRLMSVRFLFVLTAIVFGACGDDTSSEPSEQPDPPRLDFVSIDTVPSAALTPGEDGEAPVLPSPLPLGCGGAVIVELSYDFELRPPGACGATPRCGHILLRATGTSVSARAITNRVFLSLSPPSSFVGPVSFDARLVLDNGAAFETLSGDPIVATASAEFSFADGCSAVPSEGGAGGAPSGAAGEGGTGAIAGESGTIGGGGSAAETSDAGEGGTAMDGSDAGPGGAGAAG